MVFVFFGISLITAIGCAETLKKRKPMWAAALGWASIFYFVTALLEGGVA